MAPEQPPEFDLHQWVAEQLPTMVETEAPWSGLKPATRLLEQDGPLSAYLHAPEQPPEGAGRQERAQFYDLRNTAEAAAREAVADALDRHRDGVRYVETRKALETLDDLGRKLREGARQETLLGEPEREPRKPAGTDQPATKIGRW